MNEEEILVTGEETGETPAPAFTVKTILNAQMEQEASQALAPKFSKYMSYVLYGIAAALLVLLLVQFFMYQSSQDLILIGVVVLLLAYITYSRLSMPKKMIQRWEAQMIQNFGSAELHLTAELFEHSMAQSLEEDENVTVVGYSELRELRETEHLLLVHRSGNNWFFLAKDGVEGATIEDVRAFLSQRIGG